MMSNVNTKPPTEGMFDPGAIVTEESASNSTSQDANADNRVAVYVKISQRAKEILDAAATAPRTRATVIEALLESFDKQADPKIKAEILQGQNPSVLSEQGQLLQLRSWAEHAFENQRYVWAGGMYRNLANHPSSTEGLRNICEYRLSLCLIRLSYDVREEALERNVDRDSYQLALETLDRAISYTTRLRDRLTNHLLLFPKLVLYYNLASCHSLKAQYLVESKLDPKSDEVERLLKAKKDPDQKAEVWKAIGQNWSNKFEDKMTESAINFEGSKALDDLQQIIPVLSHGETLTSPDLDLLSERIWLVDSTRRDEDFIFLRSDKQRWQGEYEDWSERALRDRKPNSDAVRSLID